MVWVGGRVVRLPGVESTAQAGWQGAIRCSAFQLKLLISSITFCKTRICGQVFEGAQEN
jgi:hypothetical protein